MSIRRGSINLLPMTVREGYARELLNHKLIEWGLISMALLVAAIAIGKTWHSVLLEEKKLTEAQTLTLEQNLEPFTSIRNEALFIADRLATEETITASGYSWTHILEELAANVPPDTLLKTFTPTVKGEQLLFSVDGEAGSRASIIAMKNALEASDAFTNLQFETSQLTTGDRVTFSLNGQITKKATQ